MVKIKDLRIILISLLLVFSLFLGMIPITTVYAEKSNKNVYVFVVDDVSKYSKLKVSDSDKATIYFISTSSFVQGSSFNLYASAVANAKNSAIICIPSDVSFKSLTDANAKKIADNKADFYLQKILGNKNMAKAKYKIAYTYAYPTVTGGSEANQSNFINKLNTEYKSKLNSKFTVVSSPMNRSNSNDKNVKALISNLQASNTYGNVFKYLEIGTTSTDTSGDSTATTGNSFENTEDLLKKLGVDAKYKDNIEAYAIFLKGLGYSDAATAGILANMRGESGFNPLADEKGKNGGLFGFTPMTNFSNSKYNKNCKHKKGTAGGQSVCADGTCQIEYMIGQLASSIDSYSNRLVKANEYFKSVKGTQLGYSAAAKKVWSSKYKLPEKIDYVKNLDEFKKMDDPISAASVFLICFERAAGTYVPCDIKGKRASANSVVPGYSYTWQDFAIHEFDTKNGRLSYAEPIYSWLGGADLKESKNVEKAKKIAEDAKKKGYLSEEELSAWTKIVNENFINYSELTREDLGQSDLNSLSAWEDAVDYDNLENHGIYHFFKTFLMVIGILMMIWAALIYCCYWFDRVNPFFEFSLLSIVTFGKIATAPTDEECNYHIKDFFKSNDGCSKFVNHHYVITMCLSIVFFSILIITGPIYKIVLWIIGTVASIFNWY